MSEDTNESVAETQEQEVRHGEEATQNNEAEAEISKEKAGLQEALLAERRKRQEAEAYNRFLQQQSQAMQQHVRQPEPQEEEDEYTRELKTYANSQIKQGIQSALEQQYVNSNPQLVEISPTTGRTWLEDKLEPILRNKPYLAQVIQSAENRYARAVEIIDDYTPKSADNETRRRLEENANKPGHPAGVAKGGNSENITGIKNMSRKEFSEYRAKLRGRQANIR